MNKNRSKKKEESEEQKQLEAFGKLIDMPLDEFKEVEKQECVPVGQLNILSIRFKSVYHELVGRKDELMKLCKANPESKEEYINAINGCFAEMLKLEEKIVYLDKRIEEIYSQPLEVHK